MEGPACQVRYEHDRRTSKQGAGKWQLLLGLGRRAVAARKLVSVNGRHFPRIGFPAPGLVCLSSNRADGTLRDRFEAQPFLSSPPSLTKGTNHETAHSLLTRPYIAAPPVGLHGGAWQRKVPCERLPQPSPARQEGKKRSSIQLKDHVTEPYSQPACRYQRTVSSRRWSKLA